MKKMTTETFLKKAILKHGDNFCYSKVDYVNSQTKILIKCRMGHEFMIRPDMHINRGDGCRLCKNLNMYKENEYFKKELEILYPNLYDYSITEYRGISNKVKIICKKHNVFDKKPSELLKGFGCNSCSINGKLDINQFIKKANIIHKNRYDYSKSVYINSRTKIDIICNKHGAFSQLSNNHLSGHGCNKCNRSTGEINIENFLDDNKIIYETEFSFNDLRYRYPLRFDFAIIDKNRDVKFLIEFNGKQHYDYYPKFHKSEKDFEESLIRDGMKIEYCEKNNIKLYIIRYDDDLELSLEKIINENEEEDRI